MKCKTLHKINLLQTHTALKDSETKKERGNTHYHICLLTFICSTPAIQRVASHGEKTLQADGRAIPQLAQVKASGVWKGRSCTQAQKDLWGPHQDQNTTFH